MRLMRGNEGAGPALRSVVLVAALLVLLAVVGTLSPSASAHVRYILNQTEINQIEAGQPAGHIAQADLLSLLFLVGLLVLVGVQFLGAYEQQRGRFKGLITMLAKYS